MAGDWLAFRARQLVIGCLSPWSSTCVERADWSTHRVTRAGFEGGDPRGSNFLASVPDATYDSVFVYLTSFR